MKTACTAILAAAMAATAAMAESKVVKDIAYADRTECRLDVRFPVGETNFPTVVWFHGGGLTGGGRHFVRLQTRKSPRLQSDTGCSERALHVAKTA